MTFVKLPCRGREARCRYLKMETIRKIFAENTPNTYRRNPFHGQANKYCIFGFPKVNTMQQLFEGKLKVPVGNGTFRGFVLPNLELCKGNQRKGIVDISKKQRYPYRADGKRGRRRKSTQGSYFRKVHIIWLTYKEVSVVNDDILSPNGHLRHHKTAALRA